MTKCLNENKLRRVYCGSQFEIQSIMVEKSWQHELEVDNHTESSQEADSQMTA